MRDPGKWLAVLWGVICGRVTGLNIQEELHVVDEALWLGSLYEWQKTAYPFVRDQSTRDTRGLPSSSSSSTHVIIIIYRWTASSYPTALGIVETGFHSTVSSSSSMRD